MGYNTTINTGKLGICQPSVLVATGHVYLNDGFKNKLKKSQPRQIKKSFRAKPKRGPASK